MRLAIVLALLSSTVLAQSTPNLGFRGQRRTHASVTAGPADLGIKSGAKTTLFVDVTPNPTIHVYAPGAEDYIPITVKIEPQPNVKVGKLTYPKSETMMFADEKVPVFQKPFRLAQEVTVTGQAGTAVPIKATIDYQACDDKVCYPPESQPVMWTVTIR